MINPFSNKEKAFAPFFCDCVSIVCKRSTDTLRASVQACVFPQETVDPLADISDSSEVTAYHVIIRKSDWPYAIKIQTGDKVTLEDGNTYKVTSIKLDHNEYAIVIRG